MTLLLTLHLLFLVFIADPTHFAACRECSSMFTIPGLSYSLPVPSTLFMTQSLISPKIPPPTLSCPPRLEIRLYRFSASIAPHASSSSIQSRCAVADHQTSPYGALPSFSSFHQKM
ncbi:hypothetical protein BC629DRAFT_1496672 [Irpex lacteus]|nr:hypothetical protein BC629DRAFT_1496672 [Irpex lacteus]